MNNPACPAIRRAAANFLNAKTSDAIGAALKRIQRMGGTVEYHRPTDEIGIGSHFLGWVSVPAPTPTIAY